MASHSLDSVHAVSVSVFTKSPLSDNITTLVSKRISKHSTNKTLVEILTDVLSCQIIDESTSNAIAIGNVKIKVSKSEHSDPFTMDIHDKLETALSFDSSLKFLMYHITTDGVDTSASAPVNAFDCLMEQRGVAKRPQLLSRNTPRFTNKDRLYNNVVKHMNDNDCCFPTSSFGDDVKKLIQVVSNALWYLDGNTHTIMERAMHVDKVSPIPERFLQTEFQGFNDWKHKRKAAPFLSSDTLKFHGSSLFGLLSRKFTSTWGTFRDDLEGLAVSVDSYATLLVDKNEDQQKRQKMDRPPREVGQHAWMEIHDASTESVSAKYSILDHTITKLENYESIMFNEELHVVTPFKSCSERYHFLQRLSLSVPVCVLSYSPGGPLGKVVFMWKVPAENASVNEIMRASLPIFDLLKPTLPEYHTRQMRQDFAARYCQLHATPNIPKYTLRSIYSDLTVDSSAMQNPTLDARVNQAIMSEDVDLVLDMRHMNPGRPNDTFSAFFDTLCSKVDNIGAVDERRHDNVCHFAKYVSVPDLIRDIASELPEGTPIPSESTVLYSFVPRNAHSKIAKLYTSKVPLQFKIQTRQLRLSHGDEHYCSCIFKYAREFAVEHKDEVTFICVDDKCKVDYGEPGQAIQTGVRGKKAIVPSGMSLSALDHDQSSKGSLTPSVCLKIDVPDTISGSFYRGDVFVTYKDSVFEASTPFRHTCELDKILRQSDVKPVLIIYSDGGPDHRLTYHSVKLALIVLFKRLGIDTLIAARTAPGHSWVNPAERMMSILNIALQNCALSRKECSSHMEQILKSSNSMAEIRSKSTKHADLKGAWGESVKAVKEVLEDRTRRLSLKAAPFTVEDAAEQGEVDEIEGNVQMFVDRTIEKGKYQQQHVKSKADYQKFLDEHCRARHYTFQIRKCDDLNCCGPRLGETQFPWLPDPVLQADDKDHYQPFSAVVNTETVDNRPSAMAAKPQEVAEQLQGVRNQGLVAQNVRKIVSCYECSKPRCVYSKKSMSVRDVRAFNRLVEKYDYCCGSLITPEGDALEGVITVRLQMACETPVEYAYYASSLGRQDVCAHCGSRGAEKNQEMCRQYRIVLPVCADCIRMKKDIPKRNPIK